jgi:exonuclease SbcD
VDVAAAGRRGPRLRGEIGAISADHGDEVLLLEHPERGPELMVCAVPYLRDRDIRLVEAGEKK